MKTVRIITPTGRLGTTPLEKASFERGCAAAPDFIVADSGSADIGPYLAGRGQAGLRRGLAAPRHRGDVGSQQYAPLFDVEIP